ncbi:D-2-hydroxyacid dehydrogenase [Paenibacillus sp. MMS18-CY102]|uniref:D-2-hydroxyacid dehydrogenase n=1 Tax=Paenibacillus sp. MMS18-CY102 TaxID=2682849 RepID=UPI00136670BD|nr:D-2-hydroxyacid dehydrogenase [Paenibacillus sp. MMS18-CY102]MWC27591.1 D-2-hydroxyacid dehydrogenase [Paenibacillus sp. MMS18-CY102]
MGMMICLLDMTDSQKERIRRQAPNLEIHFAPASGLEDKLFLEAEIIFGWDPRIVTETLCKPSKLKWLQSWSSGIEYLPLSLLEERNIRVTDASGVHATSVSETILAMMLGFSRGIVSALQNQVDAKWESPPTLVEMNGCTVSIIGAGEIGKEVANLCRAFGMKIIAVRRSGEPIPEADWTYPTTSLQNVLKESDFIINILPLTQETYYLFDYERFSQMKKSAYFINVGRGSTVITDDLVRALKEGLIAGAGLDVFEEEPLPAEHSLWSLSNVILTPHNSGGNTVKNRERLVNLFVMNLECYLNGEEHVMKNVLDYRKGY